ncbi:MarR family transcriptional regulator [Flavobacteriaceae bacterium CRH]|nr:MarR family transcriptional regulator [Flavobacteriaceae bacterium CRH]
MKNIFDLEMQNNNLDGKIVAGFERLSQVFRVLLWEKAKKYDLSPIQIQLLIFIKHHSGNKSTVSYLAREFNLTKATVSDTIKILEQKKYVVKEPNSTDSRSYTIALTPEGLEIVLVTEDFTDPLYDIVTETSENDKIVLWQNISSLIQQLHTLQVINVQSTCFNCHYFSQQNGNNHCKLMEIKLETADIKLDCHDHKPVRL